MNFFKLVINEFIKILKRKSTIIFSILAILVVIFISIFLSTKPLSIQKTEYGHNAIQGAITTLENWKFALDKKEGKEKQLLQEKIKIQQYILDNGYDNIINAFFKKTLQNDVMLQVEKLIYLDKDENKSEYDKQLEKMNKIWNIFISGTFEEYIDLNIENIKEKYEHKEISQTEYEDKLKEQELLLKYELGKYSEYDYSTRSILLDNIKTLENLIKTRYDTSAHKYITDKQIKSLENQILIDNYRLENSIFPYYENNLYEMNPDSYYMYKYNTIVVSVSMFILALLIIVLASSTVSDETSKGTIKFLLITPYKRYKILLAKIISIFLFLLIATLILSQISNIAGNIFLNNASSEYLYVKDGVVETLDTNLYRTLQFLLKIPGILVYMLFGIVLSTLTRNTAISSVITSALYIALPFGVEKISQFSKISFLNYLPSANFNLIDKVLPLYNYSSNFEMKPLFPDTTLQFSVMVIVIAIILLSVTAFESFNKKDI